MTAQKVGRQPPSAERARLLEEHLERVRAIGAVIDQQWRPASVSAADAVRDQRR